MVMKVMAFAPQYIREQQTMVPFIMMIIAAIVAVVNPRTTYKVTTEQIRKGTTWTNQPLRFLMC